MSAPTQDAVAVLLLDADGWTYLAERRGGSMAGLLECPGGQVEDTEWQRVSAWRELREETGLDVDMRRLQGVGSILVRRPEGDGSVVVTLFILRLREGEVPADTEPEKRGPWGQWRVAVEPRPQACTPSTGALLALAPWAVQEGPQ